MNRKEIWVVTLSGLALFLLLFFLLFEIREVPDVNWDESYSFQSKEPYGAWVLREMLQKKYEGSPLVRNHLDTNLTDISSRNNLLVMISTPIRLNQEQTTDLVRFAGRGNDVLLITDYFEAEFEVENPYEYNWSGYFDSVLNFQYASDTIYSYINYSGDFDRPVVRYFNGLLEDWPQFDAHTTLGSLNDSLIFFDEWKVGEGRLLLHTVPQLFSNQAAKQSFYLDQFNYIFSMFDPDLVILDHVSYRTGGDRFSESPLQFILGNKSLRISYFLLLFLGISFIIFKSKRRQKVIPTLELNTNTSLEYVHALSELFRQQKQHKKLIRHLEAIFYHYVRERYFIESKDPDFEAHLVRKSRMQPDKIHDLLNEFQRAAKKLNVGDDHLINLYQQLEYFYRNSK